MPVCPSAGPGHLGFLEGLHGGRAIRQHHMCGWAVPVRAVRVRAEVNCQGSLELVLQRDPTTACSPTHVCVALPRAGLDAANLEALDEGPKPPPLLAGLGWEGGEGAVPMLRRLLRAKPKPVHGPMRLYRPSASRVALKVLNGCKYKFIVR
jgi:hypothetical protein